MRIFDNYKINKPFTKLKYQFKRKNEKILTKALYLDTETSNDGNMCWVNHWQIAFNGGLYYGTEPQTLLDFFQRFNDFYNTSLENRYICFVHNLQYDFSYLSAFFDNAFKQEPFILADSPHRVFMVSYESGLILRCTYKLTNMSLNMALQKYNVELKKLVGSYNYNAINNQDYNITKQELRYCLRDVTSLNMLVDKINEVNNDTLTTMPLTSTGYVEREIRREFRKTPKAHDKFKKLKMDVETYKALNNSFSGGYTHNNRFKANKTQVLKNACGKHRDFRSMYPSYMRTSSYFPIEPFILASNGCKLRDILPLNKTHCIMLELIFYDVHIKNNIPYPYIQTAHIKQITRGHINDDNGRLLDFNGYFTIYYDIKELLLILKQYEMEYEVKRVWIAKSGYLPQYIATVLDENYLIKSSFKKVVHNCETAYNNNPTKENYLKLCDAQTKLMKSKNILNGIYGCCAKNPIRDSITLKDGKWSVERVRNMSDEDIEKHLSKFYNNKNKCLTYAWGVYVTLGCRLELFKMLDIVKDNFLYCDTDSIFYISTDEIENAFNKVNKQWYDEAIKKGFYVKDNDGKITTYHSFDDENEKITRFKALHSKCYLYETDDGGLHCTVAGVGKDNKQTDNLILNTDELKKGKDNTNAFRNFRNGFVFRACGGTSAKYVDNKNANSDDLIFDYKGNETQGGCIIYNTTKELKYLSLNDDFIETKE